MCVCVRARVRKREGEEEVCVFVCACLYVCVHVCEFFFLKKLRTCAVGGSTQGQLVGIQAAVF